MSWVTDSPKVGTRTRARAAPGCGRVAPGPGFGRSPPALRISASVSGCASVVFAVVSVLLASRVSNVVTCGDLSVPCGCASSA